MPLKLGICGDLMRAKLDALSAEQARNPQQVTEALGSAVEDYIQALLLQMVVVIPPTPGLGTTTVPASPTGPGPAPVTLPGALVFK